MKKTFLILLILFSFFTFSCNNEQTKKDSEKNLIDEMNQTMQNSENEFSLDTSSTDSTILK